MAWLCLFRPHQWVHVVNVESPVSVGRAGLYQCSRCKTLSIGAPRSG